MRTDAHLSSPRAPTCWLAGVVVACAAILTGATSASAQPDDPPPRLVVLNVPRDGTDHLVDAFREAGEVAVEQQGWFVEQVRQLDLAPKGIMSDTDRLGRAMRGAGMDYILYLVPQDGEYEARLVAKPSAEVTFSTSVPMGDDGLSASSAQTVRDRVVEHVNSLRSSPEPDSNEQPDADSEGPSEPEDPTEPEAPPEHGAADVEGPNGDTDGIPENWLWTSAQFRLIKRDFSVSGANSNVLIYTSTYYPGLELDLEVYPLALANPDLDKIGLYLDFIQGFESIPVRNDNGDGNRTALSLSQTEFEIGPIFRFTPHERQARTERRVRLKATFRFSNYSVDPNPNLPPTSLSSIVLGAKLTQPVLFDGFAVEADLELLPIAFFGKSKDLFGSRSTTHGFSTRVGLKYGFTENFAAFGGYRFRLHHTRFVGPGISGFVDSEGFELVQGMDLGLQYRY